MKTPIRNKEPVFSIYMTYKLSKLKDAEKFSFEDLVFIDKSKTKNEIKLHAKITDNGLRKYNKDKYIKLKNFDKYNFEKFINNTTDKNKKYLNESYIKTLEISRSERFDILLKSFDEYLDSIINGTVTKSDTKINVKKYSAQKKEILEYLLRQQEAGFNLSNFTIKANVFNRENYFRLAMYLALEKDLGGKNFKVLDIDNRGNVAISVKSKILQNIQQKNTESIKSKDTNMQKTTITKIPEKILIRIALNDTGNKVEYLMKINKFDIFSVKKGKLSDALYKIAKNKNIPFDKYVYGVINGREDSFLQKNIVRLFRDKIIILTKNGRVMFPAKNICIKNVKPTTLSLK